MWQNKFKRKKLQETSENLVNKIGADGERTLVRDFEKIQFYTLPNKWRMQRGKELLAT